MIFVTLGSQKFQFNRLLKELDKLIEENKVTDKVFAQIGYSDYKPKNFNYKEFLDRKEFSDIMDKCDMVITHGGTGAIIGAIKKNIKVIAIPRMKKFNEHVDNHQLEITNQFKNMGYIETVKNISDLEKSISGIRNTIFKSYTSSTKNIILSIDEFINSIDDK